MYIYIYIDIYIYIYIYIYILVCSRRCTSTSMHVSARMIELDSATQPFMCTILPSICMAW